MKKLSILLLVTAAAAILFSSCNKEYAEPTIAWTPNDLSHYVDFADETTFNVDLAVTFGAEAGIADIQITKYIYEGDVETTVALTSPTGFDGLNSFDYAFSATNTATDFDGVTEIVYEFVVTDASETPQSTTKEYTIINVIPDDYTVTFNVVDEDAAVISDATITFDGVTNAAGEYTFTAEAGTYEYTVAKDGYEDVTVTDYVLGDADATIDVTLVEDLSAWSADVMISLLDNAYYNNIAVPDHENTTIGFKYTTNLATAGVVTTTTNCQGWVEVDNADYTTSTQIEAAFNAGTPISTADLEFDYEAKSYTERIFISNVDDEYLLVKYVAGVTCPNDHTATTGNKGNVLVFQYKN